MNRLFILTSFLLSFFFSELQAVTTLPSFQNRRVYNDVQTNPHLGKNEKKRIIPCLLPNTHPVRELLDSICLRERATLNEEAFLNAGFEIRFHQPRSFIKVASHPLIPGYLFKVLLDTELRMKDETPGWQWFVNRVTLARKIARFIKKHQVKHFVVPCKWIYPLPLNPEVPDDSIFIRKNELLVVEEMNLVSAEESAHAWRTLITKEHLDEFYAIFQHCGGASYRPDNVVYTRDGTFAFIDTEYAKTRPRYWVLCKYLSPEMADYWQHLYEDIL